jgi:hypothetical protein
LLRRSGAWFLLAWRRLHLLAVLVAIVVIAVWVTQPRDSPRRLDRGAERAVVSSGRGLGDGVDGVPERLVLLPQGADGLYLPLSEGLLGQAPSLPSLLALLTPSARRLVMSLHTRFTHRQLRIFGGAVRALHGGVLS